MSKAKDGTHAGRRGFLKGAGLAGAAAFTAPLRAVAQAPAAGTRNPVPLPNKAAETAPPPALDVLTVVKPGSEFMIDCLKSLGFEYMAANPASSFLGQLESLVNHGGNNSPEFLTCSHEEISV